MIRALLIAVLLAQAAPAPQQEPTVENRAPVPEPAAPADQPTAAGVDRVFALAAMQGGNAELDMARVALDRSKAGEVQGFAAKMMAEHEGMMHDLAPALRRFLPAAAPRLGAPDALALRHLQSVSAADFDQAYALQQIGAHLASLTVFQTEADNGTDPQLRGRARQWLPTIQAHLELAVDMTRHIGGASPFKH